jgi:5-methylcytosine-specific restriction protein A
MKKLFFCNVAWMKKYDGEEPDIISGGGSYIEKHHNGAEIFNFRNVNGVHYGFVATQGHQIRIERLKEGAINYVDNILVVWVAPKPDEGNKIIGWYNNAEVYREVQRHNNLFYNIKALVKDSTLLPVEERKVDVPRARKAGKGKGMGQSNYWYADSVAAKEYCNKVRNYIKNYDGNTLNK